MRALPSPAALRRDGLDAADQLLRLKVRLRPLRAHDSLAGPHSPDRRQFLDCIANQRQRLPQGLQIGPTNSKLVPHPLVLGPEALQLAGRVFTRWHAGEMATARLECELPCGPAEAPPLASVSRSPGGIAVPADSIRGSG